MSMPNIPDIDPEIKLDRDEAITLVLVSIAMEEIALSHIINAEGEKMQRALELAKCIDDLIDIDRDVRNVLNSVIKKEMLLQFKLEDVLDFVVKKKKRKKKRSKRNKKHKCQDNDC